MSIRNASHIHTHARAHTHTCTHTYKHTHAYTHTHTRTHTQIHTHTYTHTRIRIYTHTRIHTYTHARIDRYTHTRTHSYTYIHTRAHTRMHTHTHAHTHTHGYRRTRIHTSTFSIGSRIHRLNICKGSYLSATECPNLWPETASYVEAPVLGLWRMWSTNLLPLFPGPLYPGVIITVKVPAKGQIKLSVWNSNTWNYLILYKQMKSVSF